MSALHIFYPRNDDYRSQSWNRTSLSESIHHLFNNIKITIRNKKIIGKSSEVSQIGLRFQIN